MRRDGQKKTITVVNVNPLDWQHVAVGGGFLCFKIGEERKMKQLIILAAAVVLVISAMANTTVDAFGTGDNQFTIEFVTISGDASSANGTNITHVSPGNDRYKEFSDPGTFRIGKFEITNVQWTKFVNAHGSPTGNPQNAYNAAPYWADPDLPTNNVSWYEAAQFVNWLNTSNDHQAAYNFDGGIFSVWDATDAWGGTNLYRHKDAIYFLPTEHEWIKAAHWNGTELQPFANKECELLHHGDGISGTGWNYRSGIGMPWNVGSGSEELNGTFDMMGNVWEWTEGPYYDGNYSPDVDRAIRGGAYNTGEGNFVLFYRDHGYPPCNANIERYNFGFRVASVPEPASLGLLGLGGLALRRKQRR